MYDVSCNTFYNRYIMHRVYLDTLISKMQIKSSYRFQHIEQYIKLKIKKKKYYRGILYKMGQVYNNNNKIYQSHQFKRACTHINTLIHKYMNIIVI